MKTRPVGGILIYISKPGFCRSHVIAALKTRIIPNNVTYKFINDIEK